MLVALAHTDLLCFLQDARDFGIDGYTLRLQVGWEDIPSSSGLPPVAASLLSLMSQPSYLPPLMQRMDRRIKLFICITLYNEDQDELRKTLQGVCDESGQGGHHVVISDGMERHLSAESLSCQCYNLLAS